MLYAKFMYPDNGYDCDVEEAIRFGLKVGERYEVEYLSMGGSHTSVFLNNINGCFNSVQFEFYENEQPVDIYRNPKYSGYMYY
jgi:hypothetical protein